MGPLKVCHRMLFLFWAAGGSAGAVAIYVGNVLPCTAACPLRHKPILVVLVGIVTEPALGW